MTAPSGWVVFAFDWARYRAIGPTLQAACATGDFTSLGISYADAVLERMDDAEPPEAVCSILLAELCGRGEPVHIAGSMMATFRRIRRHKDCEEAADLLTELLVGGSNVASWFRADRGIAGVLDPEQARDLSSRLGRFCRRVGRAGQRGGARRLLRLFSPSDSADTVLEALRALVEEVAARGDGLAAAAE